MRLCTYLFSVCSLGVLVPSVLIPSVALASEITIQDCTGATRWTAELEDQAVSADLVVVLETGLSTGVRRAEMRDEAGRVLTAPVDGIDLEFSDVPQGRFKLCSDNGEFIPFRSVSMRRAGDRSSSVVLASAGLGAAGIASAIAWGGSESSESSARGGLGEFGDSGTGTLVPAPKPATGPSFDPEDYDLGAPAAPLSPYQ